MKIGFAGLGNMGAPMAINLANAGHEVVGFDPVGAIPAGVARAQSAQDAAHGADVVITMLPNGAIAHSVATDIVPIMAKGAVLLDCSTIDVASARAMDQLAQDHVIGFLDAPVSGGVGGATAGNHLRALI